MFPRSEHLSCFHLLSDAEVVLQVSLEVTEAANSNVIAGISIAVITIAVVVLLIIDFAAIKTASLHFVDNIRALR